MDGKHSKPGPNEDESCKEFKLSLSFGLKLSCTLSESHRLSCALIEFEPDQMFLKSRREFSLVWPTLHDSGWQLKKTLMRANSHPRLARVSERVMR